MKLYHGHDRAVPEYSIRAARNGLDYWIADGNGLDVVIFTTDHPAVADAIFKAVNQPQFDSASGACRLEGAEARSAAAKAEAAEGFK